MTNSTEQRNVTVQVAAPEMSQGAEALFLVYVALAWDFGVDAAFYRLADGGW